MPRKESRTGLRKTTLVELEVSPEQTGGFVHPKRKVRDIGMSKKLGLN